jgi:hypothetical protein
MAFLSRFLAIALADVKAILYTASIKYLRLACRHVILGDQGYITQRTRHTIVKE